MLLSEEAAVLKHLRDYGISSWLARTGLSVSGEGDQKSLEKRRNRIKSSLRMQGCICGFDE